MCRRKNNKRRRKAPIKLFAATSCYFVHTVWLQNLSGDFTGVKIIGKSGKGRSGIESGTKILESTKMLFANIGHPSKPQVQTAGKKVSDGHLRKTTQMGKQYNTPHSKRYR